MSKQEKGELNATGTKREFGRNARHEFVDDVVRDRHPQPVVATRGSAARRSVQDGAVGAASAPLAHPHQVHLVAQALEQRHQLQERVV